MERSCILVADDDADIRKAVRLYLEKEGFQVACAADGFEALDLLEQKPVQLILMDVMMPRMDGFSAIMRIRQQRHLPILVMSAKTEDSDKVLGLSIGADDYITKPFNPLELMARVKTQLRRYTRYNQAEAAPQKLPDTERDIRGLVINRETHKCTLYGKPVQLTPIEFSILWYLCENQGRVVSSEELFEAVWGEKFLDNNNTVMAHIGRLREKLCEPPRKPRFIKTVWGVGYQIE